MSIIPGKNNLDKKIMSNFKDIEGITKHSKDNMKIHQIDNCSKKYQKKKKKNT